MDRRVRVRRLENSPVTSTYSDPPPGVDLDKLSPNGTFNRVWMGAVPEEVVREGGIDKVYPAYACVIGEFYVNSPQQRDLPRIVLDEAVALNPADFSEEECARYNITQKEFDFPTIYSLRSALIALKDIWWPSRLIVPPDRGFWEAMLRTDGLVAYDEGIGDSDYERWHPLFKARGRTIDQGIYMVGTMQGETENRAYNEGLVNALMGADLLTVYADCSILLNEKAPTALRCAGLVLNQMQRMDEAPFRRTRWVNGAEPDFEAEEDLRHEKNQLKEHYENMRFLFSDNPGEVVSDE